jgi:uncharacterized membrane protein YhaH (DUF805 family)
VSICFLDSIFDLAAIRSSHDRVGLIFDLVFFMIFALIWPLLTIGRLLELQLNCWWIVPMMVPLVIGVVGAYCGRPLFARVALGIAFFVLLPPVFLSPPKDSGTTQADVPDDSRP